MTHEDKIIMLSRLNEPTVDDEDILGFYLDTAKEAILRKMYPLKQDFSGLEIPNKYDRVQIDIALYLLNKRGAEGQIQHIENGIHRNYGAAYIPDAMLADIVPFCQAVRT